MKSFLPIAFFAGLGLFLFVGGIAGLIVAAVAATGILGLGRQADIDARERAEEAEFWDRR